MNKMREAGWSQETDRGSYVGVHQIAPETVVLIFHRIHEGTGVTTSMPLSLEAFRDLVGLGKALLAMVDAKARK